MIKRNNEELYKFIDGIKENFTELRDEEKSKADELGNKLYGDDIVVLVADHSYDKCSICKFFKKGKCIIGCIPGDGLCWDKECILEVKT